MIKLVASFFSTKKDRVNPMIVIPSPWCYVSICSKSWIVASVTVYFIIIFSIINSIFNNSVQLVWNITWSLFFNLPIFWRKFIYSDGILVSKGDCKKVSKMCSIKDQIFIVSQFCGQEFQNQSDSWVVSFCKGV